MDAALLRSFFLKPSNPLQRQYEVVRAVVIDEQPMQEVAQRFGYRYDTVRALVSQFRRQFTAGQLPPFSSLPDAAVPPARPSLHRQQTPMSSQRTAKV
jgi:hypothetical protein